MSNYKTIVVYLPDDRRAKRVLDVAVKIARDHDAHLIGLFVLPAPVIGSTFAMARDLMAAGRKALLARATTIQAQFEATAQDLAARKEWRTVEPGEATALEALLGNVRAADLIIAAQRDPTWEDSALLDYTEDLILQSGRPVLLVPNAGTFPDIGARIAVAWNDRREAARAAFDALPLLRKAGEVRVVWVNPGAATGAAGDIPTAEIVTTLARQGVRATAAQTTGTDLDVGTQLLNYVTDEASTLLVMGAYGHRRLREVVFGGASREILAHMTVPVLMSH
jgi:nucleotide-binding universal stress UspA family protein